MVESFSLTFESCVRGYHVYYEIWTATEGKTLLCERETRSREDPFAVFLFPLPFGLIERQTLVIPSMNYCQHR
jgi:hypothetical protein